MGYAWLEWSTRTIGHRLTGTENGRRAEETADSLFRVAGMHDVAYFPFEAAAWQRRSVRVEVSNSTDSLIAYATVAWLLRYVARHSIAVFVWYRWALGIAVIVALSTGWLAAT